MSDEANNVAVLTEAYRRWHDSRGASVDHWMSICAENIAFGSLIQGAAPKVAYMTGTTRAPSSAATSKGLPATGR